MTWNHSTAVWSVPNCWIVTPAGICVVPHPHCHRVDGVRQPSEGGRDRREVDADGVHPGV